MPKAQPEPQPTNDGCDVFLNDVQGEIKYARIKHWCLRFCCWGFVSLPLVTGTFATLLAFDASRGKATGLILPFVSDITGTPGTDMPDAWSRVCGLIGLLAMVSLVVATVGSAARFRERRARIADYRSRVKNLKTAVNANGRSCQSSLRRYQQELVNDRMKYKEHL